jgi:crossover junction endodeoxyribonuclease RusA
MVREFEIPWPPSVNHYYRHVGNKVLISREGRQYRENVMAMFRDKPQPPFTGPIELYAEFYPPDARRRDLDNLLKCTQDTLQHAGLFNDDSQIAVIHIIKQKPIPPHGLTYIRIKDHEQQTE